MDEEPCLPDSVLANGNDLHELLTFLSHVVTRGDVPRKDLSAGRSCGPAIRAIESLWRGRSEGCVV
jgi:hypothetical protein